ncbi:hypothetical protein V502_07134 [Pseudogymnoascus sp. VKM F-4520 (FW-2644)]|nr:hypothetical protein V502_07134 [Pseudogymnoascus sp. VKM F-4520 (FW-2644)]
MAKGTWYRESYMISTSPELIQPEAVNAAFESDAVYWARGMEPESLKKMLSKSLCFGIYALPESSSELAGRSDPPQIGFARVITDEVTFAYLTDVYVLEEHQGKGLGSWLMECVDEEFASWPHLRRVMLMANLKEGEAFYAKMGMSQFKQGENGFAILNKRGRGSGMPV